VLATADHRRDQIFLLCQQIKQHGRDMDSDQGQQDAGIDVVNRGGDFAGVAGNVLGQRTFHHHVVVGE